MSLQMFVFHSCPTTTFLTSPHILQFHSTDCRDNILSAHKTRRAASGQPKDLLCNLFRDVDALNDYLHGNTGKSVSEFLECVCVRPSVRVCFCRLKSVKTVPADRGG